MRHDRTHTPPPAKCQPLDGRPRARRDADSQRPFVPDDAQVADVRRRAARTLKALADPTRIRLLSMIAAHEGGEACVCDLIGPVGLSQPILSHHLKQLTEAGLVTREKRGMWAYFTIVPGAIETVTQHLGAHLSARP